jgi:hypothetical protein
MLHWLTAAIEDVEIESASALVVIEKLLPSLSPAHLAEIENVINPLLAAANPALAAEASTVESAVNTAVAETTKVVGILAQETSGSSQINAAIAAVNEGAHS